ncbi:hypothetical protein [Klebsiella phage Kpn BHU3]|nr:hypothetical protein [Klebsiella phage Kpn BHU1]UJQ69749.1 hypothetical protein [Klebsiella phage Kpn BHU2]UKM96635.1 hypothetical protein [Klebsiella phage Kpn BHU3]
MSKFKVGDKVVLAPGNSGAEYFYALQGKREYYTITDTASASGYWLQLDGVVRSRVDHYPWYWSFFNMYQEPENELPPVPDSVMYYNSTTSEDNLQHMLVQPHWELEGHLSIAIVKSGKKFDPLAYGDVLSLNLEPDAALQLAHDLRRMAMEIKRKDK